MKLGSADAYPYLFCDAAEVARPSDKELDSGNFSKLSAAMSACGVSAEQEEQVFQVVAALLHLGQISFTASSDGEGSQIASEEAVAACATAAGLFGLRPEDLTKITTSRSLSTGRKSLYSVPLSVTQAAYSRDAIGKMVYSKLFGWLVARINESLSLDGEEGVSCSFIGILDIYGFEVLQCSCTGWSCIWRASVLATTGCRGGTAAPDCLPLHLPTAPDSSVQL